MARALAADPLVLLMDEPFSAVDPVVRSELHDFFLGLQRQISKTIILITHDIDEAIKLGDQVAILRVGGRLAQVGTPQQLLDEPADAFVEGFVGKDRGYRSLSFLPANGLELERVKVVRDVESAEAGEPTLMVDGDARPVGWADPDRPGQVFPLGSTFDARGGHAADGVGLGVDLAVQPGGCRGSGAPDGSPGWSSAQKILDQVADARAAVAESISVRAAEDTMRRSRPSRVPTTTQATKSPADEAEGKRDAKADEGPAAVRPETVEGRDADGAAGSTAPATKVEPAAEAEPQESEPVEAPQTVRRPTLGTCARCRGRSGGLDGKPEADSETRRHCRGARRAAVDRTTPRRRSAAELRRSAASDDRTVVSGEPVDLSDSADDAAKADDPDSDADADG